MTALWSMPNMDRHPDPLVERSSSTEKDEFRWLAPEMVECRARRPRPPRVPRDTDRLALDEVPSS